MCSYNDVLGLACQYSQNGASLLRVCSVLLGSGDWLSSVATLVVGLTFGSFGLTGRTLTGDLTQGSLSSFAWTISGGIVFNLANIIFMAAVAIAGMTVAFPVGIGVSLVEGVVINYIAQPEGSPVLIFLEPVIKFG